MKSNTTLKLVDQFNPLLKSKCTPINDITQYHKDLAAEMCIFMEETQGIGLSANQVGKPIRLFTMRIANESNGKTMQYIVCINPVITKKAGEVLIYKEGCLSYDGLFLNIKRNNGVMVEYTDVEGKQVKRDFWGIDARCFQHEIEHLDGIRMIDKVSSGVLTMAREKQMKYLKMRRKQNV